jgi:hypothetical protein
MLICMLCIMYMYLYLEEWHVLLHVCFTVISTFNWCISRMHIICLILYV